MHRKREQLYQRLSIQAGYIIAIHRQIFQETYFSLETQHTIGYGTRYITEVCPLAFIVLGTQCICGVLLQTILAGVVIAKVLRPKKRKKVSAFSANNR